MERAAGCYTLEILLRILVVIVVPNKHFKMNNNFHDYFVNSVNYRYMQDRG